MNETPTHRPPPPLVDANLQMAVEGVRDVFKAMTEMRSQQETTERLQAENKTRQMKIEADLMQFIFGRAVWVLGLVLIIGLVAAFRSDNQVTLAVVAGVMGFLAGFLSGRGERKSG